MRRTTLALAAALLGVTLAAVAFEALVRAISGPQVRFPSRVVEAPWGLRMNEPNAVYRHQSADVHVEIRIDADGFRADRDHPRDKPAGVRRIVAVGDAFTLGAAVEREQTFSSVLESELRKAGLTVEVLNAGVPGFGTAEECLYLERALFGYEPDLVLVSFRADDLEENARSDLLRFDGRKLEAGQERYAPGLLPRNALFDLVASHSDAWALLRDRLAPAPPKRDDADLFAQQRLAAAIFERIYRDGRGRRVPIVIQSIPSSDLEDAFPAFDANRQGLLLVAARAALEAHAGNDPLYYARSHQHWTPLAHRLAGEALARAILDARLLEPAPGPKPASP
ncbi:MAG TPA: hypothetical protein VEN47_15490 [Myxococcota bacterium]|nr:hypothetical protein [Myxococcota bacterium]